VLIVTFATVGTLLVTLGNSLTTMLVTLWNVQPMPYFRETSISFFEFVGTINYINSMKEIQFLLMNFISYWLLIIMKKVKEIPL